MQLLSPLRVFVGALLLHAVLSAPASAQGFTRWGDFGIEVKVGSYQIGVQKRLSQAGPSQRMCKKCAHYFEGWIEADEVEDGSIDRDVDGPALNSVIEVNPDALEIAAGTTREPLHGAPVLLKDNLDRSPYSSSGWSSRGG